LCRGQELFQRPTAVPVSIALGKDLLPAGFHFRVLSTFSHGKELFQHDLLVAVSVVFFKHLRLHRSRVASTPGWCGIARAAAVTAIAVAGCVSSRAISIAWGVAQNGSVAISPETFSVVSTATTHLAEFPTELRHFLLQLHDHAIQCCFAFRLWAEAACGPAIGLSSSARLGRIAPIAVTLTTRACLGCLPSLSVAFAADAPFG